MIKTMITGAAFLLITAASFAQGTTWKTNAQPLAEMAQLRKQIKSPVFKKADYPVTRYGAVGDGKTNNSKAFKAAIEACSKNGGGTVTVPVGTWLTGAIYLKSNVNLHLADSNRCALGEGCLDIDTVIMALYLIGYNTEGHYVTPEPLGPGGDPYPAMYGKPDKLLLDKLVQQTATYFREREEALLA